jgi:hypothetical protein
MGNAEGSAPPERQISQTNALDLVLKYAAVFAALVYGVGFLEEVEFASRLGVGSVDFPLANPRYFAIGTMMLSACLFPVATVLPAGTYIDDTVNPLRKYVKHMDKLKYAFARVSVFVLAFAGSHWAYFVPTVPALALAVVALVINGIVLSLLISA